MLDRLAVQPNPPPGPPERAAVLIPIFPGPQGELRVVITKRPDTMPTHAGHLAFPGGRHHPEDSGPLATALREAEEEVGIPPETVEVLGYLPSVDTVQFTRMVVPVVGWIDPAPVLRPSEREVAKVFTPTLESLAVESSWRWEDWHGRRVWFREIEGEVLWGATAWMTRRLLEMEL